MTSRWYAPFSLLVLSMLVCTASCHGSETHQDDAPTSSDEGLTIDPATGIPYALVFQFPITGFDTADFGFGWADENDAFCMQESGGVCISYGYHLARDTNVEKTPVGTVVVAPADGIVRMTTDVKHDGYGSDTQSNPAYKGCVVVIESEFANGSRFTTLLGHIKCESGVGYSAANQAGNPAVGTIVHRGDYVAHVNHYWTGATETIDWHHLHWGMRHGAYVSGNDATYVLGYAPKSEFTIDPTTGIWTHPDWMDPFTIIAANNDPALSATDAVRHHPSGSLLEDSSGNYWLVTGDASIGPVSPQVMASDRYDMTQAVRVSDDELGCYTKGMPIASLGKVTLYQRPGSSTVVMAYDATKTRYDVIRWEALLSWGFDSSSLTTDLGTIGYIESTYAPKGFRLMRPGTLVKADEQSEVAIVTEQQTRKPIASAQVFEDLGFAWEHVVSIPLSVIDQAAGARDAILIDETAIQACAVPPPCPGGGTCGGGGPDMQNTPEVCDGKDNDGNGLVDEIFMCSLGATDGPICVSSCGTSGQQVCEAPNCSWGACKPFPENCSNGIDDDCNGLIDCDDPACFGTPDCMSSASSTPIHLVYQGPASPGSIVLNAWWQAPQSAPRMWGAVPDCTDTTPGDGILDCTFNLLSGTAPFEFQINLPNGQFWGDEACDAIGGCGSTVGTLTITGPDGSFNVGMVANNQSGQPYFNGHIPVIP
ncbi:MAG: M23 family metallopeptidase [Patescibacteria group bacterium]